MAPLMLGPPHWPREGPANELSQKYIEIGRAMDVKHVLSSLLKYYTHHRFSAERQVHVVRFLHFQKSIRAITVGVMCGGLLNAALTKQCCNPDSS